MVEPLEIRRARDEDQESLGPLWQAAFGLPASWLQGFPQRFRPHRVLVATDRQRIVASAQGYDTNQWFGGRPVRMSGVASVATDPIVRGTGLGPRVVTQLLREEREAGHHICTLYPSTVPFYRRLGFEYGGVHTEYRLRLQDIPVAPPESRRRVDLVAGSEDKSEGIRASFRRLAGRETGIVEGLEDDWWRIRVLGRQGSEDPGGIVSTHEDVPEAYATYRQERLTDDWGYRILCQHLVAHSDRSALGLLDFFRRFKGVGQELRWHGPPLEPLSFLVAEQTIEPTWRFLFMTRILDLESALEARGYPERSEGEAVLAVEDPLFESNTGTFRLEAEGGKVRVSRVDDRPAGAPILTIGALSTMYTGFATPWAAARSGLVDPSHPALPLLAELFAGPPPWTPDFF